MINNANKYTIADIFSPEKQLKYTIPKFQREYTWSKENWEELLNDIIESEGNHFIGSIICINKEIDVLQTAQLELIDGQQRLTTISLLFCAIYKALNDLSSQDEEIKLELGNLKWRLVQKKEKNTLRIELSHQNKNFDDYKSVLSEIGAIEFNSDVKNRGNRKIFKAFRYFLSRLEGKNADELRELLSQLYTTMLVKIEVNSHSDAFLLFESLNNRGVPLSAIDLIKNKMLAALENKEKMSIDDAFEKWSVLITNLPEYSDQERFLRQFYNAFKFNSGIRVEKISKATRSNIIKIYEELIDKDPEYIFQELVEGSNIYHHLIFPEESDGELFSSLSENLKDLVNVQAAPAYTLLLYLFYSTKTLDDDSFKEIINFLVRYFVRRNITDFPNTRNLDQIFIDLIEEVEKDRDNLSAKFIIEFLSDKSRMSTLHMFQDKLNSDIYELNVDATRFILIKIEEENKKTKEIDVDFWQRDKSGKLIWTIEHIFPEGSNIPKSWVDMIADGDKEKAIKIQDELVHKLGNLTLTGYNSNLSNLNFEKKRDRKDKKKGRYIGYNNGLFLNEDLKNKSEWTEEDIVERTEKLISLAKEIFRVANE